MKPFFFIIFLFPFLCFSQRNVTIENDSIKEHSTKKAALYSTIIPGMGQIYNHIAMPKGQKKAFWKVPLVYAGLGATTYLMLQENTLKNELREELTNRINNSGELLEKYQMYDNYGVETLYKKHSSNRDLLIIGIGVVYLLNIVDAAVEANFINFDISDNISFQIRPSMIGIDPGVKLALKIK